MIQTLNSSVTSDPDVLSKSGFFWYAHPSMWAILFQKTDAVGRAGGAGVPARPSQHYPKKLFPPTKCHRAAGAPEPGQNRNPTAPQPQQRRGTSGTETRYNRDIIAKLVQRQRDTSGTKPRFPRDGSGTEAGQKRENTAK
jgi:hypothetical protein